MLLWAHDPYLAETCSPARTLPLQLLPLEIRAMKADGWVGIAKRAQRYGSLH